MDEFSYNSKPATAKTKHVNEAARQSLPLHDSRDFEEAKRGFIATLDDPVIRKGDNRPAWDLMDYSFLGDGSHAPDTVHPGLWRQSTLLAFHGLFKVDEHIYQVRSFDISNITFIEGSNGLIVFDPLISSECARAALDLYYQYRPRKPVVAVVYSHTHVDHFGGVLGVTSVEDYHKGNVQIIAPEGFMHYALSENLVARNAMMRRATYMYGAFLSKGCRGQVSAGLGLGTSSGSVGLLPPTRHITHTGEALKIDDIRMVFQLTPGTEAPVEMNTYFPDWRALWMAENCTHTLHNLYTPRGAEVRDGKTWAYYIDEALDLFAPNSDVVFASHHWPKWGNERIMDFMRKQRDTYKFLHDQALRLANHGHTLDEIAEQIELPPALQAEWYNRSYYGTVNHNVKAQYQKHFGWFDGNPAHLNPLPPEQAGQRYVEFMGGAENVIKQARVSFDNGEYRWVTEVLNHVVFAEPDNMTARELQADALEQLGYQSESGPWRNFYLTGALELREGVKSRSHQERNSGDLGMLAMIPPEAFFDYLSVSLNASKAQGKHIHLHIEVTDDNTSFCLGIGNCVLNYRTYPTCAVAPDLSMRATRPVLFQALIGMIKVEEKCQEGTIQVEGDMDYLAQFQALIDTFDPRFNIVTP